MRHIRQKMMTLCSISNKGRLQKVICIYLTDLGQNVDAEIVYSVDLHCTSKYKTTALTRLKLDTILFSAYAALCESGYSGPVVIVTECIVQLHYITGCDANSGLVKLSVYNKVAKSPMARRQLLHCGDSLDLKEVVLEDLFKFTRLVIYGDTESSTMSEARTAKWRMMKKKSFLRFPPDADSIRQHCLHANYLAYVVRHTSLKCHPSPLGLG